LVAGGVNTSTTKWLRLSITKVVGTAVTIFFKSADANRGGASRLFAKLRIC